MANGVSCWVKMDGESGSLGGPQVKEEGRLIEPARKERGSIAGVGESSESTRDFRQ